MFGHQQKILVIFVSCFTSISLKVCSGLFYSTVVFFLHILLFLISSSSFDGPTLISQEDCGHYVTLVESPRFRGCFLFVGTLHVEVSLLHLL